MPRSVSFALTIALGLAVTLAGCDRQSGDNAQPQETSSSEKAGAGEGELTGTIDHSFAGDPLPDLSFSNPDGATLKLADLKGQPVLINLWATWCAPCVLEMPMLDDLAGAQAGKLRVLTISQDLKGAELVSPFFAQRKFQHLEPWLDPKNDLGFHFGGAVLPTTILYDKDGKEVWRVLGGYDWASEEAAALIAERLGD